ncbi:hypothetical protein [Nocardia sp. JMUB6875]|uniref:hypothetical protein n=1 Tax=Nocardia sp. JMUB6875 TaxID=3158170 RepID=UPI0034E8A8E7
MLANKIKNGFTLLAATAALAAGVCGVAAPEAAAASNATPNYEVKFNLVAGTLDSTGAPTAEVRSAFGLGSSALAVSYEYFDTNALDLHNAGWDVRFRHKDGSDFDINYKKRYPVTNGDINAALTTANQQGFDSSSNYDCQVDWTTDKQVVSFANKKSSSASGYSGTTLPTETDARNIAVAQIPGKLKDWSASGWGKTELKSSRAHGPVTSKEWDGTWQGTDTSIEVVPVKAASGTGTETIIELSFKVDTLNQATTLRNQALSTLQSKGWLAGAAVLKTDLILSRY